MLNDVLSCQDVCFQLFADKTDYYHHWYHAKPTYRPDNLISDDGRQLLVEITSRFFGHGIWMNYPLRHP